MANGEYTGFSFSVESISLASTFDGTHILVAGYGAGLVYKYEIDGTYTGQSFPVADLKPIAICSNGVFAWVVGNNSKRVYKYELDGTYTGENFSVAEDNLLRGATCNGGFIWFTGNATKRVYKYELDGTDTGESFPVNEGSSPCGLVINNGFAWVVGNTTNRVYKYELDGTYTGESFPIDECTNPNGLADLGTSFYVLGSGATKVYQYTFNDRIDESFTFDGDFTALSQDNFNNKVQGEIKLASDSSVAFTEGVGLQVTGVAYYPVTQFTATDACAVLDSNDNVAFESAGEGYAVDSGAFTYLFDENRVILFSAPDVKSYLKMTGLVEQINVDNHANDYSAEIFTSQINFVSSSLLFANQNQTREEAFPNPTISFNIINTGELLTLPTHDRKTIYDSKGEMHLAGFIKGTVKQENIPAIKKVLCFTQYGQLVAETVSDKMGNFEFRELRHDKKYMITTQAGHEPDLPPDYHPDTVGYITPTPYKL